MKTASRMVLGGFELESDAEVSKYPERFGKPGPDSFFFSRISILEKFEGVSNEAPSCPESGQTVHPSYSLLRREYMRERIIAYKNPELKAWK